MSSITLHEPSDYSDPADVRVQTPGGTAHSYGVSNEVLNEVAERAHRRLILRVIAGVALVFALIFTLSREAPAPPPSDVIAQPPAPMEITPTIHQSHVSVHETDVDGTNDSPMLHATTTSRNAISEQPR